MRGQNRIEFILGIVVFLGTLVVRLLDSFQRLDYIKVHLPSLYAWVRDPSVQYGTMLVGVAVMAVGVRGVYRKLPNSEQLAIGSITDGIELRGIAYEHELKVVLQNNSTATIADCELFLAGVQRYSDKQREFENVAVFSGVSLMKPQTLRPKKRTKPHTLFALLKPNATFLIAFDVNGTRKPVCSVDRSGTWRAQINIITASGSHRNELFFKWSAGTAPKFVRDPRLTV